MTKVGLGWYWRRLSRMSVGEVAWRARDHARRRAWRRRQLRRHDTVLAAQWVRHAFHVRLAPETASSIPEAARHGVLAAADRLLDGSWEILGAVRTDLVLPDWFLDPFSGRRAPQDTYAFGIDHRSEEVVGNVKQVWELSRHHHLTVLAAAWFVSEEERYAIAVDRQLRSWWRENPFLSGVHWTSGIELGIRLIAWTWIRRLLDGWDGVEALFEGNPMAATQLRWHQEYLARFRSTGSSANNHVIAEAAGQFVAGCAFPWFRESERWRSSAAALLERELQRNTFPSGINRELASGYQRLVAELGLVAAVEGEAAGHPLSAATWSCLCRMVDSAAAIVDERLRGPRQGDGDDAQALLLDAPDDGSWSSLFALTAQLAGSPRWWPATPPGDVRSTLLGALSGAVRDVADRAPRRPSHFPDAGLTVLRTAADDAPEIWCRCDGGPHGFLSIAAHAHADALSIEVRHGGVEVLADPGTYCYHDQPAWRAYFRSTLAHNTLSLDGEDQSQPGGPFLWTSHASSRVLEVGTDDAAPIASWCAEHDGYRRLDPPAMHRRTVHLDRERRRIIVVDAVRSTGRRRCLLAFHLGPSVGVELTGCSAHLEWSSERGAVSAILHLPVALRWTAHRGEVDPILGWYSPRFGVRQAAVTLLGSGTCIAGLTELVSFLEFPPRPRSTRHPAVQHWSQVLPRS